MKRKKMSISLVAFGEMMLCFCAGCQQASNSSPGEGTDSTPEEDGAKEGMTWGESDCDGDGDGDADWEVNEGMDVAVTPEGDVIVTGRFVGTAVFGQQEAASALTSDSRTGSAFVAQYSPSGKLVFARQAFGSAYSSGTLITGIQNGVVVAGWYDGGITLGEAEKEIILEGENHFIAMYDSSGNLGWAKNLTDATGDPGASTIEDLGTLHGNEIVLYGDSTSGDPESESSFIVTLNEDGEMVSARYLDPAHAGDLAVSPDGDLYLMGNKEGQLTLDHEPFSSTLSDRDELFVARFTSDIEPVWAVESETQFLVEDEHGGEDFYHSDVGGDAVAWHPRGGAVLLGSYADQFSIGTGSREVTIGEGIDQGDPEHCFLARYDGSGSLIWTMSTIGDGSHGCTNVGVAADDRVVFSGSFDSRISFQDGDDTLDFTGKNSWCRRDYFIAAYDSGSRLLWAKTVIGDRAVTSHGLAVSDDGAIYVTGSASANANFRDDDNPLIPTLSSGLAYDYFLVKYTADGEVEWVEETY